MGVSVGVKTPAASGADTSIHSLARVLLQISRRAPARAQHAQFAGRVRTSGMRSSPISRPHSPGLLYRRASSEGPVRAP